MKHLYRGTMATALLLAATSVFAQAKPTRQTLMNAACAAAGGTRCAALAASAVVRNEPFPLVMLKSCQADLSAAAQVGPEAIDAAKDRAMACMEAAVRDGQQLSTQDLLVGQDQLRKRPEFSGLPDADVAASFRVKLAALDTDCSRIQSKFTRYNCYTRRLAALAPKGP